MLSTALKTVISVFQLSGQKLKPNAGVQASFFKGKKPEFSVRDLIVSKNVPPAAGGVLFSS